MGLRFVIGLCLFWGGSAAMACETHRFDGADFTVCAVDLHHDDLRLFLNDDTDTPFGSFVAVERSLMPHGQRLGFAMNAGMYHEDRSPVGLYIQDGIEYQRIITSDGPGNFGLLPNGVLCWTDRAAHIVESRAFAAAPPVCDYATQSGPMLVIAGDLHPRFLEHGTSLHIRNGVGIGPQGRHLYFVISENPVNFHHFGRFFRDHLNLDTALYLDGRVSRLYAPDLGWSGFGWWRLGPVIGTVTGPALDAPASGG